MANRRVDQETRDVIAILAQRAFQTALDEALCDAASSAGVGAAGSVEPRSGVTYFVIVGFGDRSKAVAAAAEVAARSLGDTLPDGGVSVFVENPDRRL